MPPLGRDVVNEPAIAQEINTAGGQEVVTLARAYDKIGEQADVAFNNRVDVSVISDDYPNGKPVFTGSIKDYQPVLGSAEKCDVILLPDAAATSKSLIELGAKTVYENLEFSANTQTESAGFANSYFSEVHLLPDQRKPISLQSAYGQSVRR
jgi:hypothetical protein